MRLLLLFPGALLWPLLAAESFDVSLPLATATRLVAAASGPKHPDKSKAPSPSAPNPPPTAKERSHRPAPPAHLFM